MEFINQPLRTSRSTLDVIQSELKKNSLNEVNIIVAWAKASGLKLIEADLIAARSRNVITKIIVGIDEGGATHEGLDLAISLFDECYIYSNPSRGTFHPKIYNFIGSESSILIGSSNLTAGGLVGNYEANILIDSTDIAFSQLSSDIGIYYYDLISDSNCLYRINDKNKFLIYHDPRYSISSESIRSSSNKPRSGVLVPAPIFRPSSLPLHPLKRYKKAATKTGASGIIAVGAKIVPAPTTPIKTILRRWWKELPASDVQIVGSGTNNTGNLRLGKGKTGVNPTVYFRNVFFGGLTWLSVTPPKNSKMLNKEEASFQADILINNIVVGRETIRVSHSASREAGQKNIPTVLHMSSLRKYLKTNFIGGYITIEIDSLGGFRVCFYDKGQPEPIAMP